MISMTALDSCEHSFASVEKRDALQISPFAWFHVYLRRLDNSVEAYVSNDFTKAKALLERPGVREGRVYAVQPDALTQTFSACEIKSVRNGEGGAIFVYELEDKRAFASASDSEPGRILSFAELAVAHEVGRSDNAPEETCTPSAQYTEA